MSAENVKAFFGKVEGDKDLQEKLAAAKGQEEEAALAEVVKIAADAGFEFTSAELAEALEAEGELSEDELKQVAGGGGCPRGWDNRCKKLGSPY